MKRLSAIIIDSVMIAYFNMVGDADGPCGKLQTWARMNRKYSHDKAVAKARSDFKCLPED